MKETSAVQGAYDYAKWELSALLARQIRSLDPSVELDEVDQGFCFKLLERPPELAMGDYAFPCFRFAKAFKRKPADIAQMLADRLLEESSRVLAKAEVVGAFLNIRLKLDWLASFLIRSIGDGSYFERVSKFSQRDFDKVMIEYSQPNTHKVFHVGHMRNVALGDSLGRIYEYCGYKTLFANYIGDEGAHIAKCLWYIDKYALEAPEQGQGKWLGQMYVAATHEIEDASAEDKELFQKEISQVLRAIESKEGKFYEFWKTSRQWSLEDFQAVYTWTGARFDIDFHESDVSDESQKIVDEFMSEGVFIEDDGAIGIDLKEDKLGFLILRKSDGNTTYATKDLALARKKYSEYAIDQSIYVVASEQNLHFRQVFKTLEKMGFEQAKNCYHLSYGMVVLPDGKMSSRKGNVIEFSELKGRLETKLEALLSKYEDEWSKDELKKATHQLSVGAIRYGMIASDPVKDIVFELDDWLSFEGNTGPYLMYSYARTASILRKAEERGFKPDAAGVELLSEELERELLIYINDTNNVILQACELKKPSSLAHHLFDMCKVYNRFFANVPVLRTEDERLRSARLALLEAFSRVLKNSLALLGMNPPERM